MSLAWEQVVEGLLKAPHPNGKPDEWLLLDGLIPVMWSVDASGKMTRLTPAEIVAVHQLTQGHLSPPSAT